jgi:hypothetical protein
MSGKPLQLNVAFKDCVLEDEMVDVLPKSRTGCFVQYDGEFQEALAMNKSVNLIMKDSLQSVDPRLVLVVKDIENDEPYAGSVSIPRTILSGGGMDPSEPM